MSDLLAGNCRLSQQHSNLKKISKSGGGHAVKKSKDRKARNSEPVKKGTEDRLQTVSMERHGREMLLLLLPPLLLRVATSRCLHDEAQKSVRLLRLPFSPLPLKSLSSSLTLPSSHDPQPLRIQTCYLGNPISDGAWDPEGEETRGGSRALAAVREATQRIQAVLAVQGPLLLSRDAARYCHAVWGDPDTPNYHRCSLLNPGYKGESCLGTKIPDTHLHGYALWPEQGPPQLVQPDGPGVQNTDFLLYVRVAHTSKCHQEVSNCCPGWSTAARSQLTAASTSWAQTGFAMLLRLCLKLLGSSSLPTWTSQSARIVSPSVIAYAACCHLDSEDRPLAGTIVYCAQHLTSPSLSHSDIVMVTIHELLHALGFSGQLFKKWRDCPSGFSVRENCSTRQQVTRQDEWGQLLLTTPAASLSLAKHLGVPGASLGVPLEEEEGPLSSHWEARLLQGSLMTATFDGAQRTRLDPITLAAFEDSGWYQVNHTAAEELLWGQGSGLEFGLVTTCRTGSSDFFCTGSGLGCHYLHLDKGSCSSDPMMEGCRMYKPLANGSECWKKENGFPAGVENPHGEIYHPQSRCFFANLTSQLLPGNKTRHPSLIPHLKEAELTGRCYLHQCTGRGAYKVQAEGSPWVPCLPGKVIQIPGYYGLLFCPRGRLCNTNEDIKPVPSLPVSLSTPDPLFQLSLELAGPPGHSLGKEQQEELAEAVLQAVASRGGTGRCYFHSPSVTTSLVFTVHMWKSPGCQGPSVAMLHRALTLTLQKQPLEVYYGGANFTTEPSKLLVTSDHNLPMTHLRLSMGLCLMLLILVGALGTIAYQKTSTLPVRPSASYHSPEFHGTRVPVRGVREV
ncbi:leishmanolysin-like peptidase 2 [Cebus imitator]|uniref:leishmanolysin-like peptidase 2 n=1 Tax=Cebus imitator TaxID=2715852 RepID=UPI00189B1E58|nr:leishmanolysin-like peptidase 2 [Cebus imitator]